MQFSFEINIGQTKFTITESAENHKEFIEKASFFTSLPTTGPNGETDLKLVKRKTAKGDYYSIISDQANMEFKLGQSKDMKTLYAKGWEAKFNGAQMNDGDDEESAPQPAAQAPSIPAANKATTSAATLPRPSMPRPNVPAATQTPAPATNTAATPAPAQSNAVNSVLAKYGIKR